MIVKKLIHNSNSSKNEIIFKEGIQGLQKYKKIIKNPAVLDIRV